MGKNKDFKSNHSTTNQCLSNAPQKGNKSFDKNNSSSAHCQVKKNHHGSCDNTKETYEEIRELLSDKLFEFIENQIEEIEVEPCDSELHQFEIGDVSLFHGSPILTDEHTSSKTSNNCPPRKKKKKSDKNLEKERIKEAAVSVDWIRQQAKLFTS